MKFFFLILAILSFGACIFGQEAPIDPAFLDESLQYVRDGAELFPAKRPTFDKIRDTLEVKFFSEDGKQIRLDEGRYFGFGFRRFEFMRAGAYCDLYASGFALDNDLARYKVGVECRADVWKRIRAQIIQTWKDGGGPEYQENSKGIFIETSSDNVVKGYKDAVTAVIGPMKKVTVPANLEKQYNYLIDPLINSEVGGACTAGALTPEGYSAVSPIVAAKRSDLLENILRGYNPGGRIYAVTALLKMEKAGIKITPDARDTIDKVLDLDSDINVCEGVRISSVRGREALKLINL